MGHGNPDNNLESPLVHVNASDYERQMRGSVLNNELKSMWKEVGRAYFEAISWHIPAGTGETYENPFNIASLHAEKTSPQLWNM
jgi:hypothetical protein